MYHRYSAYSFVTECLQEQSSESRTESLYSDCFVSKAATDDEREHKSDESAELHQWLHMMCKSVTQVLNRLHEVFSVADTSLRKHLLSHLSAHTHIQGCASVLETAPLTLTDMVRKHYLQRVHKTVISPDGDQNARSSSVNARKNSTLNDHPTHRISCHSKRTVLSQIHGVQNCLRYLGFEQIDSKSFGIALANTVYQRLQAEGTGQFTTPILQTMQEWFRWSLFKLGELSTGCTLLPTILPHEVKLSFLLYEALGALHTQQLFDIIVDYPESITAVEDLKKCLVTTNCCTPLVISFRKALQERLLHPAAATSDVIHQYTCTIKALSQLDATGLILGAVTQPIKTYLRGRRDTIRCIISLLTENSSDSVGSSILHDLEHSIQHKRDSCEEIGHCLLDAHVWDAWEPEALEAQPHVHSEKYRVGTQDIFGMLISIYGTKELFLSEYRAILSEKLLGKKDYDTEREVRTVELLKLRFGDSSLHSCEVMLKDFADSRRFNHNLHTSLRNRLWTEQIDTAVLSHLYWPLQAEITEMRIPNSIQVILDEYARHFNQQKAPRKLRWHLPAGQVQLEVCIGRKAYV